MSAKSTDRKGRVGSQSGLNSLEDRKSVAPTEDWQPQPRRITSTMSEKSISLSSLFSRRV